MLVGVYASVSHTWSSASGTLAPHLAVAIPALDNHVTHCWMLAADAALEQFAHHERIPRPLTFTTGAFLVVGAWYWFLAVYADPITYHFHMCAVVHSLYLATSIIPISGSM